MFSCPKWNDEERVQRLRKHGLGVDDWVVQYVLILLEGYPTGINALSLSSIRHSGT